MPLNRTMYAQPQPFAWHAVSHPATYSTTPLFEPPQPPTLEVPKDPFTPQEPEEEPQEEKQEVKPEAEAPTSEEAPPTEPGKIIHLLVNYPILTST